MTWDPVYAFVKRIPRGRVITYGGLAKALRLRGGARSAGRAMAASPSGKGVPWHRVVGYGGKLLIREPYASLQRKLLESEGVTLREFRVDMKKHKWTPPTSTSAKSKSAKSKSTKFKSAKSNSTKFKSAKSNSRKSNSAKSTPTNPTKL